MADLSRKTVSVPKWLALSCPPLLLLAAVVFSFMGSLASAQGFSNINDKIALDQVPLYKKADQCVQSVVNYVHEFYGFQSCIDASPAPCLCATTGYNISPSVASAASSSAAEGCVGTAEASAATAAFSQYCDLNAHGGSVSAAPTAGSTGGLGSPSQTVSNSNATNAPAPMGQSGDSGGLTSGDKIALGVGIGIGLPTLLVGIPSAIVALRKRRRKSTRDASAT